MKPGIYYDVPFDEYLALGLPSKSLLLRHRISPAHGRLAAMRDKDRQKPTDAMLLGKALDLALSDHAEYVARVEYHARRPKGYADDTEKIHLTESDRATVDGMANAAMLHPEWHLFASAQKQATLIAEIDGILCSGRPDFIIDNGDRTVDLADLKSCSNAAPDDWSRTMWKRYSIEPGWYRLLAEACGLVVRRFLYLCVESAPPFICEVYQASCNVVDYGMIEGRRLLADWQACNERKEWPGYVRDKGIDVIDFPTWVSTPQGPNAAGSWLVEE